MARHAASGGAMGASPWLPPRWPISMCIHVQLLGLLGRHWYAAGWCGERCARRRRSVSSAHRSDEATAARIRQADQRERLRVRVTPAVGPRWARRCASCSLQASRSSARKRCRATRWRASVSVRRRGRAFILRKRSRARSETTGRLRRHLPLRQQARHSRDPKR